MILVYNYHLRLLVDVGGDQKKLMGSGYGI